jgi:two-component system chemotaxis response regulator CheY
MTNSILVVEDDLDLRELLIDALSIKKYRVFGAANGKEALETLEKEKINLVLTDFHMPKMNGAQMIRAMMEKHRNIPVIIFISGFQDLSDEDAYDVGASAIMRKPMDMDLLLQNIEDLLQRVKEPWVLRPPRYESQENISIKLDGFDSAISAKIFNIGNGGAFVQAPAQKLPLVESTVFFKIDFADLTLSGIGIIRWVRPVATAQTPSGFGLEFLFLDEPGRSQLRKVLTGLGRKSFIPKS